MHQRCNSGPRPGSSSAHACAGSHITVQTGDFPIDGSFAIATEGYTEPRLARAQARFLSVLSRETGIPFLPTAATGAAKDKAHFIIQTTGPSKPVQELGEDESYHLTVTANDVHLSARQSTRHLARAADLSAAGACHAAGLQRFCRHD